MRNYRKLVPIFMVVIMALSWYTLVSESFSLTSKYNEYLEEARKQAELGVTKYAIENYNLALEINPSVEVFTEVAGYYKKQNKVNEWLSWSESFIELYPTEPAAYDSLIAAYIEDKDYASAYDILNIASKRNVTSKYIKSISEEVAYTYKLDYTTYENVGVYSNNYSAVQKDGLWGFVDRYGKLRISCKYKSVGSVTGSNYVSVVNSSDDAYFIDKTGAKVLASKDHYLSYGLLIEGIIPAVMENGKYTYINEFTEKLFGSYDFASSMNNGIAAVKNGETWMIIDSYGKETSNKKYEDIKLDEKNIAYRNERLFVKVDGKYIMVNSSGKQIGLLSFEDAKVFSNENAVVKINGKWAFIDKNGKLISDKVYEDARPLTNGLAAVKIDGRWGFVDASEKLVIENIFFDAKDFNEKGSCFVNTQDKWQLLKLYRLNREG